MFLFTQLLSRIYAKLDSPRPAKPCSTSEGCSRGFSKPSLQRHAVTLQQRLQLLLRFLRQGRGDAARKRARRHRSGAAQLLCKEGARVWHLGQRVPLRFVRVVQLRVCR